MNAVNQIKLVEQRIEKCFLTVDTDCTYAQLFDFGCSLTSFALENMKAQEEKMKREKEELEAQKEESESA